MFRGMYWLYLSIVDQASVVYRISKISRMIANGNSGFYNKPLKAWESVR